MRNYLTRFAGTITAALILIILLGYLYFFELKKTGEEGTKEKVFPELTREKVNEIDLRYPKYDLVCKKEGDNWFLSFGLKRFKADSWVISDMLDSFSRMEIDRVVSENPDDLVGFGLDSPRVEVIAKTADREYGISIGGDSPVGSGTYIRINDEKRVLLVSRSYVSRFLDRSAKDVRDKQILALDEDKIKRMRFTWRGSSFEVERKGNDWIGIGIPEYLEIDQTRVRAILSTFLNLRIDNFENDEPRDLSPYGLDKPSAGIEFFEDGNPIGVFFGNRNEKGNYYLKLGSGDEVYSVSEFVFRQVPEGVNDIRVRKIVKVDADKINGMEIRRGDKRISVFKEGDTWKVDGKKADESKVRGLISEIEAIEVERFVEDNPGDLSPYGLDRPDVEITISEGDKKITLLLGKKEDKSVYAKLADKGSVYALRDEILTKIPSSKDGL
jgi:hypothetical protein